MRTLLKPLKSECSFQILCFFSPSFSLSFLFSFLFLFFFFLFFQDRVSLCSPSCPGTHFADQASLKLRNLPSSASQVLGLKSCTNSALFTILFFLFSLFYFSFPLSTCNIDKMMETVTSI